MGLINKINECMYQEDHTASQKRQFSKQQQQQQQPPPAEQIQAASAGSNTGISTACRDPDEHRRSVSQTGGGLEVADRALDNTSQLWDLESISSRQPSAAAASFSGIYAVGDNPAADIRGANQAGDPWVSVLVRTGVFQGGGANSESDPAHMVVTDVLAAVQAGLHRARSSKWHSMR